VTKTRGEKKRALVTGASAGIGAAFARRLASQGYDLLVVARDRARLEALARELEAAHGVEVEVVPADLTEPQDLEKVEQRAARAHLELLVNNAGFGTVGPFHRLDPDREEQEIRLNVIAVVRLTRAVLPGMLERNRGAIINVSSVAAFQPTPFNATYGATKAFVNSFTEAVYEEIRGSNVRLQALCPGFTRTEFQARAGIKEVRVPDFVWMQPEEVVDASLAALARGQLICVPGLSYKALTQLTGWLPRPLVRRISGTLGRSFGDR
jgi:short-subunit dehydrogenase